MASKDHLGNPLTATGAATRAAIDDFVGGLLGYETRALAILPAAENDPGDCLANAYAAALHLLLEAPAGPANAAPFLDRAEAAAGSATERERGLAGFVRLWQRNDIPAALDLGWSLVQAFPRDLVLVKLHQYLAFNRGDVASMLRVALPAAEAAPEIAAAHGMLAFAYEECHLLRDAERAGWQALDLAEHEPWAEHALAHVMLTEGRIREGQTFLDRASDGWAGLNSFMQTHLGWHQALFALSLGRLDRALDLYDRACWGIDKSYSQDQIGAVSLLARIELAGLSVGARWDELAGHLAARAEDTVLPFLSLQYLYGLARAGRDEAATLLAAIGHQSDSAAAHERPVWREVALPVAVAIVAFLDGAAGRAADLLRPVLPRLIEIGGSHAQRDLFELIHLDALRQAGRWAELQQRLEARRGHDPDGVVLNRRLAETYRVLRLPIQAAEAAARAERTLARA